MELYAEQEGEEGVHIVNITHLFDPGVYEHRTKWRRFDISGRRGLSPPSLMCAPSSIRTYVERVCAGRNPVDSVDVREYKGVFYVRVARRDYRESLQV
jgi:hypothetical protein